MENIDALVETIDLMLNTASKRHIVAGVLISFALLFGGLAVTAITMKGVQQ